MYDFKLNHNYFIENASNLISYASMHSPLRKCQLILMILLEFIN